MVKISPAWAGEYKGVGLLITIRFFAVAQNDSNISVQNDKRGAAALNIFGG